MLGVTGDSKVGSLRILLRERDLTWYPLIALSLLVIVDEFQSYAFVVLGPEISRALGIGRTTLAAIISLKTLAITLATLPMAAFVQKRARRAAVSITTAFAWGFMTMLTGFVTSVAGMIAILVADGASSGSVRTVHPPLLLDSYPPEARVRTVAFYRAADYLGNIFSPLLVGALTALLGFTWRGVFLIMGLFCLIAALASLKLRDPGFGRWDEAAVRTLVRSEARTIGTDDYALGFFEIVGRLFLIPTIRRALAAQAVLGMLIVPLNSYLFFFLDDRWGMGPGARGVFFAVLPIFSIATLTLLGRRGEALFRTDPSRMVRAASLLLGIGVVALAVAIFSPVFGVMVVLMGTAFGCFALVAPALTVTMLSIVPARMRPHASALAGIFLAAVGGFGGLLLLGGIDRRFGTAGAIASLAIPGLIAAVVLRGAARTVDADLDRMVDGFLEEEELHSLVESGVSLPLLSCRGVDFSYGNVQVLFGVDFTVNDGEMVALLGTNGAGKSTLLRVIAGLALPTKGAVRLHGQDVTYVGAERRARSALALIPGGKATFGPMSVVENLRLFGYTHGRDRSAIERAMESSFEVFPRLAERRNQQASTLSGGEQQMLGLARALIMRPKLLLIDELSLGLAPKVVGELLEIVRTINKSGTAVVLVEQSVNVALSLVEHAYFMEKGQIRFDGRSRELLGRTDLLRSVFLEGAARGTR